MFSARLNELRKAVGLEERHACLVSSGPDVRWLSGFTGSNASLLLMSDSAHLFTDGRYTEQASQETEGLEIHIGSGSTIDSAHTWARNHQITDLIVNAGLLTYQDGLRLFHGERPLQYREISSFLQLLRAEKNVFETNSIKTALRITEQTVADVLPMIREGITEKELATEIDYRQRCLGAEKSSFETIVAFGKHSSLPHARPSDNKLTPQTPILLDFGCVIDGYASDMTRMVHFGKPTGEFLQTYATVHPALAADGAPRAARFRLGGGASGRGDAFFSRRRRRIRSTVRTPYERARRGDGRRDAHVPPPPPLRRPRRGVLGGGGRAARAVAPGDGDLARRLARLHEDRAAGGARGVLGVARRRILHQRRTQTPAGGGCAQPGRRSSDPSSPSSSSS